LRGITLEVPPLRARTGDLPRLCDHLLHRIAAERAEERKTLAPDALDLLAGHRWPGNVRELENALRAASLFAEGSIITADHFADNVEDLRGVAQAMATAHRRTGPSPETSAPERAGPPGGIDALSSLAQATASAIAYSQVREGQLSLHDMKRQIERECVGRALAETGGNITRAAALLGMKRPRLSQLVKQYGLASISSEEG
jgi:DNA-binding NtrC family response regulator